MPEPPKELERGYAAARTAFEAHAAKLSPDELTQFLDEVAVAIQKAIERDGVPEGYERDLLRQLGVRADLDDPTEYWRQLWAEFRRLGFSEMEFWLQTPRDGCAVLESELRARSAPPPQVAVRPAAAEDLALPRKRGRPRKVTLEQLRKAKAAKDDNKTNNEAAKLLYGTQNPKPGDRRSVPTLLKYHSSELDSPSKK